MLTPAVALSSKLMGAFAAQQLAHDLAFRRSFVTIYDQFGRPVDLPGRSIGETATVRVPARFTA